MARKLIVKVWISNTLKLLPQGDLRNDIHSESFCRSGDTNRCRLNGCSSKSCDQLLGFFQPEDRVS